MLISLKKTVTTNLILFSVLIVGFMPFNRVYASAAENSAIIAAIVLNLARFTEWPATAFKTPNENLRLCVFGDSAIQSAFTALKGQQAGKRNIMVIQMARLKNPQQCHLLYVSSLDRSTIIQLLKELRGNHVLTVSGDESSFLEDGGMIFLKMVAGKMNLQISINALSKDELKISSRVLQLATIVD